MAYRILIVEDEYWTAQTLATKARDRGALIAGPVSSIAEAINLLSDPQPPDVAILDIHLRTDEVFPLADLLQERGIPFVFATGSDRDELPPRFAETPHLLKSYRMGDGFADACIDVARALASARAGYAVHEPSGSRS